jgi:hypothetical protein
MAYAGKTAIVIPKPLRSSLGLTELDLGMYDSETGSGLLCAVFVIYYLSFFSSVKLLKPQSPCFHILLAHSTSFAASCSHHTVRGSWSIFDVSVFIIQVRYECMVVNSGITFIALAGWLYKMYMGLMAVFCTNSVNILAGVNGLEVGQTVIIACAVCSLNHLLYDWSCLSWLESLHQT